MSMPKADVIRKLTLHDESILVMESKHGGGEVMENKPALMKTPMRNDGFPLLHLSDSSSSSTRSPIVLPAQRVPTKGEENDAVSAVVGEAFTKHHSAMMDELQIILNDNIMVLKTAVKDVCTQALSTAMTEFSRSISETMKSPLKTLEDVVSELKDYEITVEDEIRRQMEGEAQALLEDAECVAATGILKKSSCSSLWYCTVVVVVDSVCPLFSSI